MIKISSYVPQREHIAKFIKYYYFWNSVDPAFQANFIHYPHYCTTLNIHIDSEIQLSDTYRSIYYRPGNPITSILTNNCAFAKKAILKGPFNIIGIQFKPLGILNFLPPNRFPDFPTNDIVLPTIWPNLTPQMKVVFKAEAVEKKVEILDDFFDEHFSEFSNRILIELVNNVLNTNGTIKIQELADQLGISRRTISRLFKKYLGCSATKFKQVVKFRNALDEYQEALPKPLLSELSYKFGYYDEADLIKHFKLLAHESPKQLLTKLSKVNHQNLYWRINPK